MNKHLVCSLIIVLIAGGCGSRGGTAGPSDKVMPVPAGNFSRQWVNSLKLEGGDAADELHLRDDILFVYSKKQLVYAISRRGGDLRYLAAPEVTGGTLRPPTVIGEYVVYPCGSTLEVFNKSGKSVKTIDLEKPTRSACSAMGTNVFLGLDHTGGTGVLCSVEMTRPYHYVNWEMLTGKAVTAAPAIYEKTIYCGSEDGKLYAINADRKAIWTLAGGANTFNTTGRFVSDLVADDYGVYAANTDSKLYCLDRLSGKMKWVYYAGTQLKTPPVAFPSAVYQWVPSTGIVAIDKANGQYNRQPKWIVKDATQVLSEDAQNVYLRSTSDHILAVDKKTGQIVFQSKTKWDTFATNTADPTIFVGTSNGEIAAIKPVLREGEVGVMVMDFRLEPIALAQ